MTIFISFLIWIGKFMRCQGQELVGMTRNYAVSILEMPSMENQGCYNLQLQFVISGLTGRCLRSIRHTMQQVVLFRILQYLTSQVVFLAMDRFAMTVFIKHFSHQTELVKSKIAPEAGLNLDRCCLKLNFCRCITIIHHVLFQPCTSNRNYIPKEYKL